MSNQVAVQFKVSGGDLDAYIQNVQKKSAALSNDAIKAAIQQTERSKELLAITNKQIEALEKKSRLETQAARSILLERRAGDLAANASAFEARRNEIYANTGLTEQAKREKIIAATGSEAGVADKINAGYKEQLTALKATEKESKMQTALAKENIEALKATAKENIKAINSGDLKLVDVIRNASTDEQKLVAKLTSEGIEKEKKQLAKEGGAPGILGALLTMDNVSRIVSSASQLGQSQNGFDSIGNSGRTLSTALGTALGAAIGSIVPGVGTVVGAGAGGSIGSLIGGTSADFLQRQAIAKQENYKALYRYSATTGGEVGSMDDLTGIGVSAAESLQRRTEFARRRGTSVGSGKSATDSYLAEKAFGLDPAISAGLVEIQRTQKENNRDLAELIGGVILKGQATYFKNGDTTFLGEFLSKFTVLQKELLKTSSSASTGATMDIMSKFNSVGGEWATADPRSSGLLSTVNNSLSNPNTDFKKAMSFYALKKDNPDMSLADLIVEQQKGLASPKYFNSMMAMATGGYGDESSKRLNVAGILGLEGNQKFADDIYSGYTKGKFKGGFQNSDLYARYKMQDRAEENTSDIDKNGARIQNALLGDSSGAAKAIVDAIENGIQSAFSGATIEMKNGTITFPSKGAVKTNQALKVGERKQLDAIPSPFGLW